MCSVSSSSPSSRSSSAAKRTILLSRAALGPRAAGGGGGGGGGAGGGGVGAPEPGCAAPASAPVGAPLPGPAGLTLGSAGRAGPGEQEQPPPPPPHHSGATAGPGTSKPVAEQSQELSGGGGGGDAGLSETQARPGSTLRAGSCGGGGGAGAAEPPSAHGRPRCGRGAAAGAGAAARGARGRGGGGEGGGGLQWQPGVTSTLGSPAPAAPSHSPSGPPPFSLRAPPGRQPRSPARPVPGWVGSGSPRLSPFEDNWGRPAGACVRLLGCAKCALPRSPWRGGGANPLLALVLGAAGEWRAPGPPEKSLWAK